MAKTGILVIGALLMTWAVIFTIISDPGTTATATATAAPGPRPAPPPPPPPGPRATYRELQTAEFDRGLFPDRQTPPKDMGGGLGMFYHKGFLGFDCGTLRIAIRNTTPAFQKYIRKKHHSGVAPLILDPPRIPKTMTYPPSLAQPHIEIHELAEGTRVVCDGKTFDFIQGNVTINGTTFSAIDMPPTLIVLDSRHVIQHVEKLPAHLFPPLERKRSFR